MAHPMIAPAFITLGGKSEGLLGPRAYTMALRARSDSLAPSHVSAAAPRVRTRPLAPVTKSPGSRDLPASRAGPGAVRLAHGRFLI